MNGLACGLTHACIPLSGRYNPVGNERARDFKWHAMVC